MNESVASKSLKVVPTKAALLLKNRAEFTVTVFEEPKPWSSNKQELKSNGSSKPLLTKPMSTLNKKDDQEFDIKKARHEVINFALNGMQNAKNKKKMQIVQAIKLGAKPPKKAFKNYKDLLDEKKRLKTIREERQKFHQLGKNQTGAASVRCSIRKNVAAAKKKKKAPVNQIAKNYGVVNPSLKRK